METIGISPRFFKHELHNYSDWRKSFWRELIQNSVDENCRSIDISVLQVDGACEIEFADNGPGMDEETMRNVYFQLGATGKEGADTIGGHGRARILTCFAHDKYEIRTRNLLCKGEGGSFEIDNTLPFFKGCSVTVRISEADSEQMQTRLEHYLETCQIQCEVKINGEIFRNWLYKRKATRQLTFGTIHTIKTRPNYTVVRVRGVTMFERYSGCETGTILEIEAAKSRDILPVSRDSLKYDQQQELDNFISEITVDRQSLKRDCTVNKTEVFGKFRKSKSTELRELKARIEEEKAAQMRCTGDNETIYHGWESAAYMPSNGGDYSQGTSRNEFIPDEPEPEIPFAIHFEDAPKHIAKAAEKFAAGQISGTRLKLLAAWDATVEFVMEEMEAWQDEAFLFMPGFVFGDPLGLYRKENVGDNNGHIIHINPLDTKGKIRVSCHDVGELYSIALHECAHILRGYHDETYAGHLTELIRITSPKIGELKARVRGAVANVKTQNPERGQLELPILED